MNKRLIELFDQSVDYTKLLPNGTFEFNSTKFAELIVRECLSIVKSNTYGPNGEYDYSYSDESAAADNRAETIYKDITHHFGVEE